MLVVVASPLEVRRARELERAVVIPSEPVVLFAPVVPDAWVGGGKAAADLLRRVRGCIVGDDDLEILEVLGQQRLELAPEEPLPVSHREPYADVRAHAFESSWGHRICTARRSVVPCPDAAQGTLKH